MKTDCAESLWVWSLPTEKTPGVAASCERAMARISAVCSKHGELENASADAVGCERDALLLSSQSVAEYGCLEQLETCSAEAIDSCILQSSFGDEICDAVASRCGGVCNARQRGTLNGGGVYYKPEIQEAARECTRQQSCDEARGCLSGWFARFGD
jgi:hypothetical protein